MNIKLIKPNKKYKDIFYYMVNDYAVHNELDFPKYFNRENDSFEDYLIKLKNLEKGINLKHGFVPSESFWLLNNNKEILGSIRFRKELNEFTFNDGGNIGYDICPSHRNKGYGTLILRMLIKKLNKLYSNSRMLITCEVSNIQSNKIVINNGGILENTVKSKRTGNLINRYWLDLKHKKK